MDKDARISKEALEAWGVRFPSEHEIAKIEAEKRALLRDQFAMAALPACIAGQFEVMRSETHINITDEQVSADCYRYADAMLKERAK